LQAEAVLAPPSQLELAAGDPAVDLSAHASRESHHQPADSYAGGDVQRKTGRTQMPKIESQHANSKLMLRGQSAESRRPD
jgi:hypothetical protein